MKLTTNNFINRIFLMAMGMLIIIRAESGYSLSVPVKAKLDNKVQKTIRGQSGGSFDSKGCGFIADVPNHILSIPERLDYMRLTLQTSGGQPTLLVLGPKPEDRFCVLGEALGLQPEISGVWEAGKYKIYVGDRYGENYQFTLDISTQN